ncbi:hypothetical protein NPIL_246611 [Nephila pilipes]|uniref:Uncharacterized protein n=1 Tax=Nephila pilipes TaxID=299642 RepID=A0A8X6QTX6_NEPPI|nr:hypothetical protein NPIL_246611 [Nephila pilipes]
MIYGKDFVLNIWGILVNPPKVDGHVWITDVKMKNGEFLRPVERLIPLELPTDPDVPDQRTGVRRDADDSSSDINPDP